MRSGKSQISQKPPYGHYTLALSAHETNFSHSEVGLRVRVDLQLSFNRAQLVELGLEKLSALKTDHADARYEVREIPKIIMWAPQ